MFACTVSLLLFLILVLCIAVVDNLVRNAKLLTNTKKAGLVTDDRVDMFLLPKPIEVIMDLLLLRLLTP